MYVRKLNWNILKSILLARTFDTNAHAINTQTFSLQIRKPFYLTDTNKAQYEKSYSLLEK